MEEKDFSSEIFEKGFLLYYNGHLIGGEGIPCNTPPSQSVAVSRQLAGQRIKEIINGCAEKSYMLVVGARITERMATMQCRLY